QSSQTRLSGMPSQRAAPSITVSRVGSASTGKGATSQSAATMPATEMRVVMLSPVEQLLQIAALDLGDVVRRIAFHMDFDNFGRAAAPYHAFGTVFADQTA